MPNSLAERPRPAGNTFAMRLTQAIVDSGLTLSRIRSDLAVAGHGVSVATLSYWSTGRSIPTRTRSRLLLDELERVLGVQPGWLTGCLWDGVSTTGLDLTGRRERLAHAIEDLGIRRDKGWEQLTVHHISTVGADRAEKSAETRELVRAPRDGMQFWAMAVTDHAGPAECHALACCELLVQHQVEPGAAILSFAMERPLRAGEALATSYRVDYPQHEDPSTELGYGLTNVTDFLVLETVFEGEMAGGFRHGFSAPDGSPEITTEAPVLVTGNRAQVVLERAQPGIHWLRWEW